MNTQIPDCMSLSPLQAQMEALKHAANMEPIQYADISRPRKGGRPQDSAEHNVPEGLSTAGARDSTSSF